jgi:hypothetical protein
MNSACVTGSTGTAPPQAISNYCLIAKGITYSEIKPGQTEDASNKYDTPETVKQVKDHDLAYTRVCPPAAQR